MQKAAGGLGTGTPSACVSAYLSRRHPATGARCRSGLARSNDHRGSRHPWHGGSPVGTGLDPPGAERAAWRGSVQARACRRPWTRYRGPQGLSAEPLGFTSRCGQAGRDLGRQVERLSGVRVSRWGVVPCGWVGWPDGSIVTGLRPSDLGGAADVSVAVDWRTAS